MPSYKVQLKPRFKTPLLEQDYLEEMNNQGYELITVLHFPDSIFLRYYWKLTSL